MRSIRQARVAALMVALAGVCLLHAQAPVPAPPTPAPAERAQPAVPAAAPPALPAVPAPVPRLAVLIDPAHGGSDPGARLSEQISEKEITLTMARRLRADLQARGLEAALLRDSDATLSLEQRAAEVNRQRPLLYVALHAAPGYGGVRVYTSMLPALRPTQIDPKPPFYSWPRAQARALERSEHAAAALMEVLAKREVPARQLQASVAPLNHIATAALALEMAAPDGSPETLASPAYQRALAASLGQAIAAAWASLREQP